MYESKNSSIKTINTIWHAVVENVGVYIDNVNPNWGIGFTKDINNKYSVELIGPTVKSRKLNSFLGDEYWGVELKFNTTICGVDKQSLIDRLIKIPVIEDKFYLNGELYKIPTYSELEDFISNLEENKILIVENQIDKAISGDLDGLSHRSWQRLFRQVTGLTRRQLYQIERITKAYDLLKSGRRPVEVANIIGYSDQSHMIRELKTYYGLTPSEVKG